MTEAFQPGFDGGTNQALGVGALNQQAQFIRRILDGAHVATLVQVISCTNVGGVSPVGTVNVQPLVDQIAGDSTTVPHGVLHEIPYFRLQGGTNAVILDPQPGDIGIAVFADRDISKAKATKAQAAPGSFRKFDMADGLYIGGVLNGTPSQYVQFSGSGVTITSLTAVTINAPTVAINGAVSINGASLKHNGTNVGSTHVHGGVAPGNSSTAGPQ